MTEPMKKSTRRWQRRVRYENVAKIVLGALLVVFILGIAVLFLRRWAMG
ncbi:MAG TPA: hypothetical protein VEJ18_12460 [Planctomycetota bacterium]|nr:hypothetical protein [Planctomycetota bacterium]